MYVCVSVRVCDVCEFLFYVFVHALMYLCFEGKCIITLIRSVAVVCGVRDSCNRSDCANCCVPH